MLMAELPPGMSAGDKRHYHHGEECLLCLEGRVSVMCGEEQLVLETGDSCHYDGRVPHAIENCGPGVARVLIAITPAAFEPIIRVRGPRAARGPVPAEAETLA
jgi:mannose-6-phosphate isomerase-like protein (cupin superfamily)